MLPVSEARIVRSGLADFDRLDDDDTFHFQFWGTTKARARIEALINANSEDMVEVLIQLAKSGDVQALKLVTQHLLPAMPKQIDVAVSSPVTLSWMPPDPRPEKKSSA